MKVDKQMLMKHHFWILLGVFAVLAIILLIIVPIGVGAQIEDKENALKKMNSDLASNQNPKSNGYIAKLDEQKARVGGKREAVHNVMYTRQRDLLSFPEELQGKLGKLAFGDEIPQTERNAYAETYYTEMYEKVAKEVSPTEFAGGWRAIMAPITWNTQIFPTSEEIWLSLEDFCVRREILRIIHEANMMSAAFLEVKDPKAGASQTAKLPFRKQFRSRIWQLDLVLDRKDRDYAFRGKLKNISGRRQVIYKIDLNVWIAPDISATERSKPVRYEIQHEALAADQEIDLPEKKVQVNQAPTGLYRVEQILDFRTVPVKVVKTLDLGRNAGHRMADRTLKMAKFSLPKDAAEPAASGTPSPSPAGGPPSAAAMSQGMYGMGGNPGGSGASGTTTNGLAKTRYLEVTDQVRRMPVAIVLLIDQTNIDDLLAAFSNSPRMRFQNTQLHWTRAHSLSGYGGGSSAPASGASGSGAPALGGMMPGKSGTRPPGMAGGPSGAPGTPYGPSMPRMPGAPGMPGMPGMPGGAPSMPGMPGMPGMPAAGPGMPGAGQPDLSTLENEQLTASIVELTLYGVANVYERPKEPEASSADKQSAGVVPAASEPSPKSAVGDSPATAQPTNSATPVAGDSSKANENPMPSKQPATPDKKTTPTGPGDKGAPAK